MTATSPDPSSATMARLYLLGAFRLEVAGQPVSLPTRKAESLLAYLALHPEPTGHSRERLAALFWGDSPDADARRSLRVALTGLRKALAGEPFAGDRASIGFDPAYPLWVDALTLEDLSRRYLAGGDEGLLAACTVLYQGDLLADHYDDWLTLPRDRLRSCYQQALRAQVERRRERGDYIAAAEAANRLLSLDPADESAHQQLMFCYLALGDRTAARRQYEACVAALRDELAVPPSDETEALAAWIEVSPPTQRPRAGRRGNVPLPLTRLVGRQEALTGLEQLLTSPNGRPRLVTLTGPGGNGKTRLAQEAGHLLAGRFRDGAWWADLVPLADPAQVPAAVARVLGVAESADETVEDALADHLHDRELLLILDNCEHLVVAAAGLAAHLLHRCPDLRILATSRETLGVPGERAYPVAPLPVPPAGRNPSVVELDRSPAVALFVARAADHQPGFCLTQENGPTIAHICRRLDGIPLAIELAAARVSALSVRQIADRLDDRFRLLRSSTRTAQPRQQTLQALMDWSYDLLTPEEQAMFRRLAVFAGGWGLDAAEAVYCATATRSADHFCADEVLDLLGQLAAKSLLVTGETPEGARYGFLETILVYARQRLADPVEAMAAANAHLAYFLRLAQRIEPELRGPEMHDRLAQLGCEHDNLRAALTWAFAADADPPRRLDGLRLAAALELFWYTQGLGREGRRWLEEALARAPADAPEEAIARAHAAAGTMAWLLGDLDTATAHHQAALTGYRALGDSRGEAWAMGNLAVCMNQRSPADEALRMYAEAASRARGAGAHWEQALILNNWSAALIDLDRADEAIPLLEESAANLRQIGDEWAASHPTLNLVEIAIQRDECDRAGRLLDDMTLLADRLGIESLSAAVRLRRGLLHLRLGQPAVAANAYRAALQSYIEIDDRAEAIRCLEGLALAFAGLGAGDRAARLLAAADAQRAVLDSTRQPVEAAAIQRCRAQLHQRLAPAVLAEAQKAGRHLTLEDAAAEVLL